MDTRVYIADISALNDPVVFESLLGTVPECRREKAMRFKFQSGKSQSLAVGILLRQACLDFGIEGADADIVLGENGKPAFRDIPDIHFNLSHSKERAMCVISPYEVGCDVEWVKMGRSRIAERFFMESEVRWIHSFAEGDEQDNAFFRLWILKECYMKVTGCGLALSPEKFSFAFSPDGISLWHDGVRPEYAFRELNYDDGYRYAYCLNSAPVTHRVKVTKVNLGGENDKAV